jgi:hypothetical protein
MRVKNIDSVNNVYQGQTLTPNQEYTLEASEVSKWSTDDTVLTDITNLKLQVGNDTEWISGVANQINELTGKIKHVEVDAQQAFASKYTIDGKALYKRMHGGNATISASSTGNIDHVVTYNEVKFTGACIINCNVGDTVNFTVHDDANNTYSGLDVGTYGANVQLNKFGYDVEMSKDFYENTSQYDASLYVGMIIRCSYSNNDNSNSRYIGVNFEMHEVV